MRCDIFDLSEGKKGCTIKSMNRCFHTILSPVSAGRVHVAELARQYVLISRNKASVIWSVHNILDFNHVEKCAQRASCDISFALCAWRSDARIQRKTWKLQKRNFQMVMEGIIFALPRWRTSSVIFCIVLTYLGYIVKQTSKFYSYILDILYARCKILTINSKTITSKEPWILISWSNRKF